MKKLYATFFLALGLLAAKAQTFSPALVSTEPNTYAYNFSQVKGNESKQIDFIIFFSFMLPNFRSFLIPNSG